MQSMLLDIMDNSARVVASGVTMRRVSWLQNLGITPNVQQTIDDLPFDGQVQFSDKMDKTLDSLKDSRTVLPSLGAYTPVVQRNHYSSQQQQQCHPQCMSGQSFPFLKQQDYPRKGIGPGGRGSQVWGSVSPHALPRCPSSTHFHTLVPSSIPSGTTFSPSPAVRILGAQSSPTAES